MANIDRGSYREYNNIYNSSIIITMKPLELQVGKSYRNRIGEIETIIKKDDDGTYHFVSQNSRDYRRDGYNISNSAHDLIEEVTELNTNPMRPTDEQIKAAADKYVLSIKECIPALSTQRLIAFAKTLFPETEEETWERINKEVFDNLPDVLTHNQLAEGHKLCATLYHSERKRIENL